MFRWYFFRLNFGCRMVTVREYGEPNYAFFFNIRIWLCWFYNKRVNYVEFLTVAAIPQRYLLAVMVFLAIVNVIMMRSCLSLALTQMVVHKTDVGPMDEYTCPANEELVHTNGTQGQLMVRWTSRLQRNIKFRLNLVANQCQEQSINSRK